MLKAIEQWLFPYRCCLCDQLSDCDQDLCTTCYATLPWIEDRCFRCGLCLENGLEAIYCVRCQTHPPAFDRLCTLFSYEPPVIQLITGLKFAAKFAYGQLLGKWLNQHITQVWYKNSPLPEAIVPIPLHVSRLRKRGFNQALELLGTVKKEQNIPIITHACEKIRNTPPQAQMSKQNRKRNLNNAFRLKGTFPFKHAVIMDDVVTTGSTVNALSTVLKEAGVVTVDIWCICRA